MSDNKYFGARDIMSDEAWDMVWEGLKEYCKANDMEEDYIKYDTYFRSHLTNKTAKHRQKYCKEGMDSIIKMFEVTEATELDTPK
tara:strand:+ start:203 stop:457 length:255 start_codon:yes stop_codon:yes gene_type:complete